MKIKHTKLEPYLKKFLKIWNRVPPGVVGVVTVLVGVVAAAGALPLVAEAGWLRLNLKPLRLSNRVDFCKGNYQDKHTLTFGTPTGCSALGDWWFWWARLICSCWPYWC